MHGYMVATYQDHWLEMPLCNLANMNHSGILVVSMCLPTGEHHQACSRPLQHAWTCVSQFKSPYDTRVLWNHCSS